jgi:hypothetical protein
MCRFSQEDCHEVRRTDTSRQIFAQHLCRLGRKTMRLSIGRAQELFCTSYCFRNVLKLKGKHIDDYCSICYKDFEPDEQELTYCSASCGHSFRSECITKLRKTQHKLEAQLTVCFAVLPWRASIKEALVLIEADSTSYSFRRDSASHSTHHH